jgi:hypothetical protein
MKRMKLLLGLILIFMGFATCEPVDHEDLTSTCDQRVIISKILYKTAPSDLLHILSTELIDGCLKIQFATGGCDGSTWQVKLIDSGELLYSDPPQRNLRLSLDNNELCDAYIGKEITFDVKKLQVSGNEVLLNITNSNTHISYKY